MLLLIPRLVTTCPEIRVGCIGAVEAADMRRAVVATTESPAEMGALPRLAA